MANGGPKDFNEWLLITIMLGLFTFLGIVLWYVLNPIVGPIYRLLRQIETLGLWSFTGWGRYFSSVRFRDPFEFYSLFLSSIPFGVFSGCVIVLLGYAAWQKVKDSHINNFSAHKALPGYTDIMRKVAPLYPHNEFFLKFDMSRYPLDRGLTGTPMTAQELLRSVGAAKMVGKALEFDIDVVKKALISVFGPSNPFLPLFDLQDHGRAVLIGSADDVRRIVNAMPWHHAILLYATLTRVNAQLDAEDKAYLSTIKRSDEYMRDVWRQILALVDQSKLEVVLDVVLADGTRADAKGEVVTLQTLLKEQANTMDVVINARAALAMMVSGDGSVEDIGRLNKKIPITCVGGKGSQSVIWRLLSSHGYTSGTIAACLEETRKSGIFPPNIFLWMRFMDQDLWRFLDSIGLATPRAESAGVFEHYRAEVALGSAIRGEPFVDDAPSSVIREARRYVIKPSAMLREAESGEANISASNSRSLMDPDSVPQSVV